MASSGLICFIDMREAGILMWFQLQHQHLAAFGSRVCRVMQVQHPLDRGGDVVLSPFWQLAEPVACFLSSSKASGARAVSAIQTNAPVWFEIRLHPVLAGTSPATSAIRHGRAGPGP